MNTILYLCKHCGVNYNPDNSTSSLRMTYCNTICEVLDLGFHLKSLEDGRYEKYKVKEEDVSPDKIEDHIPDTCDKNKDNDESDGRKPVPA